MLVALIVNMAFGISTKCSYCSMLLCHVLTKKKSECFERALLELSAVLKSLMTAAVQIRSGSGLSFDMEVMVCQEVKEECMGSWFHDVSDFYCNKLQDSLRLQRF